MNRTKLPIHEILVEDRQRRDLGDIAELAESLRTYGLIQPIVITQSKRLLAGGRRLAAATQLGWSVIDVVYRETLTADEAFEIELEENIRRKDMSWQERCLNVAKIYSLKRLRAAEDGEKWGMEETAAMLGSSKTNVHYCITLARELQRDPKSPLWQEPTMKSAWDLILRYEKEALEEELRRRSCETATTPFVADQFALPTLDAYVSGLPDPLSNEVAKEQARERYLSNPHNDKTTFEDYWQDKLKAVDEQRNTVYLTNRLVHGDSIAYMNERPNTFDHIVTDIPYGIDINMLDQQNPHGGMVDIDTIRDEHDVKENLSLYERFFPAAFATLKEAGFLVTWCDIMNWQLMYDLAIKAGFKVQRWPLTWNKTHRCMNQCAQYNFTKSTEIAIVCRKGNAVLMDPAPTCVITASNEEMRREIDHPFAKPYECWEFILQHISFEGQSVLEPFAGRGSGVISMIRLQRYVVGVEINQAHYNALLENVKKHYLKLNPNFKFV